MKSKAELKTIYDKYSTKRTKEFIDILRNNSDKNYLQLLEILEKKAFASPVCSYEKADSINDNITNKTREQLRTIAAMYMTGGSEYVH